MEYDFGLSLGPSEEGMLLLIALLGGIPMVALLTLLEGVFSSIPVTVDGYDSFVTSEF